MTIEYDDLAFGLYLLGHDSAANHEVGFASTRPGVYDVAWRGRIALTYVGEYALRYAFNATIKDASFSGLIMDRSLGSEAQVRAALERYVSDPSQFRIDGDALKKHFLPFEPG